MNMNMAQAHPHYIEERLKENKKKGAFRQQFQKNVSITLDGVHSNNLMRPPSIPSPNYGNMIMFYTI